MHEKQKGRRHNICDDCNEESGKAQVGAGNRRKIIIVRFFHDIKDGSRRNHCRGRIINKNDDISFQNLGGGGVRSFREFEFRERIVPFLFIKAFREAFLIHGKCVNLNFVNPGFYFLQKGMVHPVVHVAQHNVGLGAVACMKHLHAELFASDSSSYQSRIKNNGFHKSVLGTPKHLILFRFFHPAGGISS